MPAVPTFAVDDGFAYSLPEGVTAPLGSLVRVPLGGRRVRGYVVAEGVSSTHKLRPLLGRSGDALLFSDHTLQVCRWLATHYVAPLAAVLAKTAPPNVPKWHQHDIESIASLGPSPLPAASTAGAAGRHTAPSVILGPAPWDDRVASLAAPVLAAERSVMVVMPTWTEASALADRCRDMLGSRVLLASSRLPAKDVTEAWGVAATTPGHLLIGTLDVALWPVTSLSLAVLIEDGRRGLKERATPRIAARDVLWRRSTLERFPLVLAGSVPTTSALSRGVHTQVLRRPWGLVEVVDRRSDLTGAGMLAATTRHAINAVAARGGRVFVFAARHHSAARCVKCGALRTCATCGARPDPGATCTRCGAALGSCAECGGRRFEPLGAGASRVRSEIARFRDDDGRVVVGTERDIPAVGTVELAVIVDADGLMRAPHYRAGEDALRLMGRVAGMAAGRGDRRCIVQTVDPTHPAVQALRRGDPLPFLRDELVERQGSGFPPAGELMEVVVTRPVPAVAADLAALGGTDVTVLGPSVEEKTHRWLIQGRDLGAARVGLRSVVQDWRDAGATVAIDVDPIDL